METVANTPNERVERFAVLHPLLLDAITIATRGLLTLRLSHKPPARPLDRF